MSISLQVVTELVLLLAFAALVLTRLRSGVATRGYLATLGVLALASLIPHVEGVRTHANGRLLVHPTEFFHYYLGTKYFAECGYYGLYEAATMAEYELAPVEFRPEETLRHLRKPAFEIRKGDLIAQRPGIVRRFSPERWQVFKADYAFFRSFDLRHWGTAPPERDHGYNGTPLTTALLGGLAAQPVLSTARFVSLAAWFDGILMLALTAALGRILNWEAALAFLALWALNPLNDFAYTGGAYLRHAPFAVLVLGLALYARNRRGAGGVALAVSAGLRLIPGVFAAAVVAHDLANPGRLQRLLGNRRFYAGLMLGAVAVVAVTWHVRPPDGGNAWVGFAERIVGHTANWSPNRIGLPFLLSYSSANELESAAASGAARTGPEWIDGTRDTFTERRFAYVGIVALGMIVSIVFLRSMPAAQAPFVGLVALFLFTTPSHYDYALLGILPVLFPNDRRIWLVFAALSGTLLVLEASPDITRSPDRAHAAYSAAVGVFLLAR
jgi:hypothetical protein